MSAALAFMGATAALGVTAPPVSASTTPCTTVQCFTLSVTPSENLTTGEQIAISVTRTTAGTVAGLEITWVAFAWCTATFTAPISPDPPPNVPTTSSFPTRWGGITGAHTHCTTKDHPLNGDLPPNTVMAPPLNSTGNYPTVTDHLPAETSETTKLYTYEVTTLHTPNKTAPSLQCDVGHPCRFAVAVFTKEGSTHEPPIFLSVPVTFATGGQLAGCSGGGAGGISSASPGRLGPIITDWTVGACKDGLGGGAALTANVAANEGDASSLEDFANGTYDMAYSAVGYGATRAFAPSVNRPYVAVPVAIDAEVLGHLESYTESSPSGQLVLEAFPQQLRITDAQAAQLLGGGPTVTDVKWSSPLGRALVAENPELEPALGSGEYYGTSLPITLGAHMKENLGIVVTSLANAGSFFATSFFHTVVPHSMVSVKTGATKSTSAQLGITADFGRATPPFNVDSTTGTILIAKALTPGAGQGFALVDAATAASMWGGLADFAIQAPSSIGTGDPVYVAPTEASMDAATTEMIPQADGTLLPNPNATPIGGVEPYPLTFVEYAIVPAQPLVTSTCTPRTATQQDLKSWLDYVTGPGQTLLPPGIEPLTPALEAQAQTAIAKVGTAKVTGSCVGSTGGPGSSGGAPSAAAASNTGAASAASASATPGSGDDAFAAGAFGSNGSGTGGSGERASSSHRPADDRGHGGRRAAAVDLAGFDRVAQAGWLLPALGVLVLVLLLPGLAFLMSGRPLRMELEEAGPSPGPGEPANGEELGAGGEVG